MVLDVVQVLPARVRIITQGSRYAKHGMPPCDMKWDFSSFNDPHKTGLKVHVGMVVVVVVVLVLVAVVVVLVLVVQAITTASWRDWSPTAPGGQHGTG